MIAVGFKDFLVLFNKNPGFHDPTLMVPLIVPPKWSQIPGPMVPPLWSHLNGPTLMVPGPRSHGPTFTVSP